MPQMINKRLFNAKEAANYLSISKALLYQLVGEGRIQSVNINTRRLFDVNDLDKFIDKLKTDQK